MSMAFVAQSLDVVLMLAAIGGIIKSGYNGYIRRIVRVFGRIDRLGERVGALVDRQAVLVDAVIALAVSQEDPTVRADPERLLAELRDDTGPGRFIDGEPRLLIHERDQEASDPD